MIKMAMLAMDDDGVKAAATPMSDRLTSQQMILVTLMKMVMMMMMMMMMTLNGLQVSDYKQVVFYEVATP